MTLPMSTNQAIQVRLREWTCNFPEWTIAAGRSFERCAVIVALADREDRFPGHLPEILFLAATDGVRGVLVHRAVIAKFLAAHLDSELIFHRAARSLAMLSQLAPDLNLYRMVHEHRLLDVVLAHQLHQLARSGGPGASPMLPNLADHYLDSATAEELKAQEHRVPENLSRLLHHHLLRCDPAVLRWAAMSALALWHIAEPLLERTADLLVRSNQARGYVSDNWLDRCAAEYGLLTHDLQLKASIVLEAMNRRGIAVDLAHVEKSSTGLFEKWSGAGADLIWSVLSKLKQLKVPVWHPDFRPLAVTGRTSCGGGIAMQALPQPEAGRRQSVGHIVRRAFVPRNGHVFIACDYRQLELVALAVVLDQQFGLGDSLRNLINRGEDIHRLIAAQACGIPPEQVTHQERQAAKAISFGVPGGMAHRTLQQTATSNFGVTLNSTQVDQLMAASLRICPELRRWREEGRGTVDVFTMTGRLRAAARYAEARNTAFQGLGADGAIEALWRLWRAGYKIVNFVHDEIVVELPIQQHLHRQKIIVEEYMREGMETVLPGMKIGIESKLLWSLDPTHQYDPADRDTAGRHTGRRSLRSLTSTPR